MCENKILIKLCVVPKLIYTVLVDVSINLPADNYG